MQDQPHGECTRVWINTRVSPDPRADLWSLHSGLDDTRIDTRPCIFLSVGLFYLSYTNDLLDVLSTQEQAPFLFPPAVSNRPISAKINKAHGYSPVSSRYTVTRQRLVSWITFYRGG